MPQKTRLNYVCSVEITAASTLSREGFAPNSRVMMLFVSDNGIINCLFTNRINVIMDITGKPTEMTDLLTPQQTNCAHGTDVATSIRSVQIYSKLFAKYHRRNNYIFTKKNQFLFKIYLIPVIRNHLILLIYFNEMRLKNR